MPRNHKRVRIERGLYKAGDYYYACASPAGSRKAVWKGLGPVGVMEARRLHDKFAAEVQGAPAPVASSRLTFGSLADEWLGQQRIRVDGDEISPRTFEGYELALRRHIGPFFNGRQVRTITPEDLVGWIRALRRQGYAPHSVHNFWGAFHLVLAHAVRIGVIASSPAAVLTAAERPKPGNSRRRFLDRHEIGLLLDAAPTAYGGVIACGLFSGLRLSELLGLTWGHLDFRGETIRVRQQMGRDGEPRRMKTAAAHRDVVLMAPLAAQLKRLRLASSFSRDHDLVFATATGRTVGHRNVASRGLTRAANDAGLEGVTFHVLRHTFASILIAQGHDPVFVSRQLGHTNAAITLTVYAHLFDAERHAQHARRQLEADYGALLR